MITLKVAPFWMQIATAIMHDLVELIAVSF